MAKTYRPYLPEQDFLLPPSPRDWLPEGHLAYFVSDLIDQLDLSAITTVYEDEVRGYPPYHPVMLTKVLVYAYCIGIFSSRRIQRRLAEDVGFRVLAAGNEPDFRTIADFRKRHLAALKNSNNCGTKSSSCSRRRRRRTRPRMRSTGRIGAVMSCRRNCSDGRVGCSGFAKRNGCWRRARG